MNQAGKELLTRAVHEISALRRDNEIMAARLSTLDTLTAFLFAVPPPQRGGVMSGDIVYEIHRHLAEEKARQEQEAADGETG